MSTATFHDGIGMFHHWSHVFLHIEQPFTGCFFIGWLIEYQIESINEGGNQIHRKVTFKIAFICYVYFVCINGIDEKRHCRMHIEVLQKIITGLDDLYEHDIADLDMQGDVYEYMLGKLSTAGKNGQFRTPKQIRDMMVRLLAPGPDDKICEIIMQRLIQFNDCRRSLPLAG